MKPKLHVLILTALVVSLLGFALGGCMGAGPGPAESLARFLDLAMEDGVLSSDEVKQLLAMVQTMAEHEESQVDWTEMVAALAGTAASTFLGVNFYRNRTRERDPRVSNRVAAATSASTKGMGS